MNTIPQFLNEFLKSQYEENIAKNIINGYSKNRPITLRANTLKTNIDYIKNPLVGYLEPVFTSICARLFGKFCRRLR